MWAITEIVKIWKQWKKINFHGRMRHILISHLASLIDISIASLSALMVSTSCIRRLSSCTAGESFTAVPDGRLLLMSSWGRRRRFIAYTCTKISKKQKVWKVPGNLGSRGICKLHLDLLYENQETVVHIWKIIIRCLFSNDNLLFIFQVLMSPQSNEYVIQSETS